MLSVFGSEPWFYHVNSEYLYCFAVNSWWNSGWKDWQGDLQKAWGWFWRNCTLYAQVWYSDSSFVVITGNFIFFLWRIEGTWVSIFFFFVRFKFLLIPEIYSFKQLLVAGAGAGVWAYTKHRQKTNVHIMALNLVRGVPLTPKEKETMLDLLTPPPSQGARTRTGFWWWRLRGQWSRWLSATNTMVSINCQDSQLEENLRSGTCLWQAWYFSTLSRQIWFWISEHN